MSKLDILDSESIKAIELLKEKGLIPSSYDPNEEILVSAKNKTDAK